MPEQDHNERKCILENGTGNILVTEAGFLDLKRPYMHLKRPLIDLKRSHMDLKMNLERPHIWSQKAVYGPDPASYGHK